MTVLGAVALLIGTVIGSIALYQHLTHRAVEGFTTVILLILILGGLTMVGLGLIGLYVAHIFEEVKARPPYRVDPGASYLPAGGDGRGVPDGALQEIRATPSASAAAGSIRSRGDCADQPSGET